MAEAEIEYTESGEDEAEEGDGEHLQSHCWRFEHCSDLE